MLSAMSHPSKTFPWSLFMLFEILHMATCYPTIYSNLRKWAFAPGMVVVAAYLAKTQPRILPGPTGYMIGTSVTFHTFCTLHIVYIQDGFPNFWRRVKDGDHPPSTFSFWRKVWWMLDLAYGSRKVGWVQEPRGALPPRPQFTSRIAFIASNVFWGIVHAASVQLMHRYWTGHPSFGTDITTGGPEFYLSSMPLLSRLPDIVIWGTGMLSFLTLPTNVMAVLSVGTGLYDPDDFPPFIGSITEAYTVRRLWG